jgi:hypothetical protein
MCACFPSPRASGTALSPAPELLAPGAGESGGFPARLRQETRTSLCRFPTFRTSRAHSPTGSHRWNRSTLT